MLRLDELHQAFSTMSASAAAVLEAAPRRLPNSMRIKNFVYANRTRFDLFGYAVSFYIISRPDARRKAKLGIIRQCDRFFLGFERSDRQRRTECFLLHSAHVIRR